MKRAAAAALSGLALVMIAPACGGDHSRPAAATEGRDDKARLDTAVSYLQKVRETADPTLYVKAQGLLDDLAARAPDDPRVLEARGALALAQHRFEDAAQLGQEALRVAPRSPTAYGILVDADNELGRYDAALTATQEMVDARPSLQSYAARVVRTGVARRLPGRDRSDATGGVVGRDDGRREPGVRRDTARAAAPHDARPRRRAAGGRCCIASVPEVRSRARVAGADPGGARAAGRRRPTYSTGS